MVLSAFLILITVAVILRITLFEKIEPSWFLVIPIAIVVSAAVFASTWAVTMPSFSQEFGFELPLRPRTILTGAVIFSMIVRSRKGKASES